MLATVASLLFCGSLLLSLMPSVALSERLDNQEELDRLAGTELSNDGGRDLRATRASHTNRL